MSTFDAIVVGSGVSGGWCAKELSERGLKVLVLERGPEFKPSRDQRDQVPPWERPLMDRLPEDEIAAHYPKQSRSIGRLLKWSTQKFWAKDSQHPYETAPDTDFAWVRGHHTGGRSVTWGRVSLRLSPMDYEANARDGHGVDWPVRYDDIAPWYDHAERFAGVAGQAEGLPQLPDGIFQPPFALNPVEAYLRESIKANFPGRTLINSRNANLTAPTDEQRALGRGQCQARAQCNQGCAFKAYFSSVNATLPAAMRTGNCTIKHEAIVESVIYDEAKGRVTGVRIIDATTKEHTVVSAKLVFLAASSVASSMILFQSANERFPNGLANRSGVLGKNVMDHVSASTVTADIAGFNDLTIAGRRPTGVYIPRYGNVTEPDKPYIRGFGFQGSAKPFGTFADGVSGIGQAFKEGHQASGPWRMTLLAFGEMLPRPENHVKPHPTRTDEWGLPIPLFNVSHGANEQTMMEEARRDAVAMFEKAGATNIHAPPPKLRRPGDRIHEMGTARMGRDPKTSVLNGWNQAHDIPNLFVTDGAFMASSACQNPSLTYMAFSARASDYAAEQVRLGRL